MTTSNPSYHTFGDAHFPQAAYPGDAIQTEIDGITYTAQIESDDNTQLEDHELDHMTARDYRDYLDGNWGYVGIVIMATIGNPLWGGDDYDPDIDMHTESWWGYTNRDADYLTDQANELLNEVVALHHPTHVTGRQAIAYNACADGMRYVLNTYMSITGRIPSLDTPIPIHAIDDTDFREFALQAALTYPDHYDGVPE